MSILEEENNNSAFNPEKSDNKNIVAIITIKKDTSGYIPTGEEDG